MLLRHNHSRQVLWLLAPLVLLLLAWELLKEIFNFGDYVEFFDVLFVAILSSLCFVYLLSEILSKVSWLLSVSLVILLFIGMGQLCVLNFGHYEKLSMAIGYIFLFINLLLSVFFARIFCRKIFKPVRFVIFTIVNICILTAAIVLLSLTMNSVPQLCNLEVWEDVIESKYLIVGVNIAVILPFEILAIANKYWRDRFMRLLRYSEPNDILTQN